MATFNPDSREIVLSADERAQLIGRLQEYDQAWAQSRFALLPPVSGYTPPASVERFSPPLAVQQPDAASAKVASKLPAQLIQGPFQGLEQPPFDDSQTMSSIQGNVICAPFAGQTPSGELLVRLYTGQGPQLDAWANAGVLFWAFPSTNGTLQFYPGPGGWDLVTSVRGLTLGGGSAAGALHVRSGISVCTLQPFSAGPMIEIMDIFAPVQFQIGQNSLYPGPEWWNVDQTEQSSALAYPSGWSHIAKLPNVYACWTWITAAVSTRGNAGVWIDVSLNFSNLFAMVP